MAEGEFPIAADKAGNAFELRPWRCPTCGPGPKKPIGTRGGRHQRYGSGVESAIVQCARCSLLFADPFPIPLNPGELYGDPSKYFEHKDEARKIDAYRRLVRQLCEFARTRTPRLLDVGSGRGEFLRAAQLEGVVDTIGLDFSQAMIDSARERYGIRMLRRTIEEFAAESEEPFDAVVLNAVIEHVYDPDAMAAACSKLLRRDGVLFIDVPNEPNLLTLLGNSWNRARGSDAVYNLSPTWPPYHVYGFNPRAIRVLLTKHGFEITRLRKHAGVRVPHTPQLRDRAKAYVGRQVKRIANLTGTASNMTVWARHR
jgi:SAM-dependent methyltransferase